MFNDARVWLSESVEDSVLLSKEVKRHGRSSPLQVVVLVETLYRRGSASVDGVGRNASSE